MTVKSFLKINYSLKSLFFCIAQDCGKLRKTRCRDKDNKVKNPLFCFLINCVSLASLNTSRDIFQESLHINVSTYHCLYYLPIDKKFLLYSEHEQVIKYNMNVYTVEVSA